MNPSTFIAKIQEDYTFKKGAVHLGCAMTSDDIMGEAGIKAPLSMFNRHGLIAGATGTGKSKSLQVLAEQLSKNGVPSLLMDVKGDMSGLAIASAGHPKIDERMAKIGLPFEPTGFPVELLSISDEPGARLRATVTEFGPILLSKILELNDTQEGVLSVVFQYCDDHKLPLLDLKDLKQTLQYFVGEGKDQIKQEYGHISSASVGAIQRRLLVLEQQGAEKFFGEISFDVADLTRTTYDGKGFINIIRLTDIQDKPHLFSTFMLQLLAEVYSTFPEEGDLEKPKLVLFIDEAHLIFREASKALLSQIESIIKLIRSKGVGIFFITQSPDDVPNEVLGQLGMKIQHALRAFTAKDRKAIKLAAQNFPLSEYYDIEQELTELGIGEALVSVLQENGRPTPVVRTYMRAPESRMDVLSKPEMEELLQRSTLVTKYNETFDRQSANDILQEKIARAQEEERMEELRKQREKEEQARQKTTTRSSSRRNSYSPWERALNNASSQIGRTVAREVARGILGVLGVKKRR